MFPPEHYRLSARSVGQCVPLSARGRVHSVFPRACNIELQSGELVTALTVDLGDLPAGIRCAPTGDSFREWLCQEQVALIDRGILEVPQARFCVDFSRAPVWRCPAVRIDTRDASTVRALSELRATLRRAGPAGGFSALLLTTDGARSSLERSIRERLQLALPFLATAVRRRSVDEVSAALSQLIGLGVGLTPSGDDFTVGCLAALHSRSWACPGIGALLGALAAPLGQLALGTNAISRQQLHDAAHGRFARRLVSVLQALALGEGTAWHAQQALRSGFSSGADTLCGLLFGLSAFSATTVSRPPNRPRIPLAADLAQAAMPIR